jgi:protein O-mannosyl-transferase
VVSGHDRRRDDAERAMSATGRTAGLPRPGGAPPKARDLDTRRGAAQLQAAGTFATALMMLAVVIVALLLYAGALRNGFVWDDRIIVDKQLAAFRTPLDLVRPPAHVPQFSPYYYRPIVVLTYLIDAAVGGGAPWAFHATSMLVHGLTCGLVFLLLLRLLGSSHRIAAAAGAVVFAVHPIHTEVAAWMAGRSDSLATLGAVAALLAWGRWLETGRSRWLVIGGAAWVIGLLGKEAAAAVAPLAAALPWVWPERAPHGGPARRDHLRNALWVAIGCAMALYAWLRWLAIGFTLGVSQPSAVGAPEVLSALGFYLEGCLWPFAIGTVRTAAPTDRVYVVFGIAGLALWAAGVMWAVRRRAAVPIWALAWIALGVVPALLLVMRSISETPVADRYFYLPSVGVALLIGSVVASLPQRFTRIGISLIGVLVAGWALLTIRAVPQWRDDFAFWSNAASAVPDEGFAQIQLARVLDQRGDADAAEATLRAALSAQLSPPQRVVAFNNLGWTLLKRGRCDEAVPLLERAVAADARFAGPYRGLAECLWPRGEDAAVRARIRSLLERAVSLDPTESRSALLLAKVALAEGDRAQAIRWLEQAMRANPRSSSAAEANTLLAGLRAG